MSKTYQYAPHVSNDRMSGSAPNAALLIDFDNVTMGMRSDLSKDLRKLLESDVIRGKVTVQRAYADWRRYPQYIVPLSENSIDLIFAPAYGSSKKNATDIRMAIDGMELVFTRPEIGTFILLTGDSDFSSLVLKLKEYGKYVIGVGIQESSSDILVQNCDEYYSYTNLAGLTKTTETDVKSMDPWVLVEKAVKKMQDRNDVMRSDRLKQVMLEIDSSFDEGSYGFSKFSKFVTEAASRKLITLKKMPNGQYEVTPGGASGGSSSGSSGSRRKSEDDRGSRGRSRGRRSDNGRSDSRSAESSRDSGRDTERDDEAAAPATAVPAEVHTVEDGFALLIRSLEALKDDDRHPVRDSDVKRKMLEYDGNFDEGTLGFSKFSKFLQEAREQGVVQLERQDGGSYEVTLVDGATPSVSSPEPPKEIEATADEESDSDRGDDRGGRGAQTDAFAGSSASETADDAASGGDSGPVTRELRPEDVIDDDAPGRRLGPRGGTTRRRGEDDDPPPIFEGQGRPASGSGGGNDQGGVAASGASTAEESADDDGEGILTDGIVDLSKIDLPEEPGRIVNYLTNYRGVGEKTAQQVVEAFGKHTFFTLQERPDALKDVIPQGRADQLLAGWKADVEKRIAGDGDDGSRRSRSRRGRRGRGGRR